MSMEIGNGYTGYSSQMYDSTRKNTISKTEQEAVLESSTGKASSMEEKILTGMDYLNQLQRDMPGTAFFVGMVSYGQIYGNGFDVNFVVNPQFLEKLGTDADATKEFEESVQYLNNFSRQFRINEAANGWEVVSQGWFCDENGDWGGWTITRKTDKKSFLENFSENADKINQKKQEQKQETKQKEKIAERQAMKEKVITELREESRIRLNKLYVYAGEELESDAAGTDKDIAADTSVDAYTVMQDMVLGSGFKNPIAQDAGKETETYSGSVTFNEAKRARQLAAAKSLENVRVVMGLLSKDLSDCQSGLETGMCDENEVAKVKAMIQKANQKMSEVSSLENTNEKEEGFDTFSINMLL